MPSDRIRRRPVRNNNLPEALQRLLAGEDIQHTKENWLLLRDVRYFRLFHDVLDATDLQHVAKQHGEWMLEINPYRERQ